MTSDQLYCEILKMCARLTGGAAFLCDEHSVIGSVNCKEVPDKVEQELSIIKHLRLVLDGAISSVHEVGNTVTAVFPWESYWLVLNNHDRVLENAQYYKIIEETLPYLAQVAGGDAVMFNRDGIRFKAFHPDGSENRSALGVLNELCRQSIKGRRPSIGPSVMAQGATAVRVPLSDEYGIAINNRYATQQRQRLMDNAQKYRYARYHFEDIIGDSEIMLKAKELAMEAAKTKSTILITGETGTGKELFAQAIHNFSLRASQPFVAINCGALPYDLVESTLFGYAPGTFTGAKKQGQRGAFEQANGGTLFLDEISEMPYDLQVKLLRVIQEREVVRLGDAKVMPVDVRIITSTNRKLPDLVQRGEFRVDLFFRINVMEIKIPPLRNHKQDLLALLDVHCKKFSNIMGKRVHDIAPEVFEVLTMYDWPGNVRELQNCMEYAFNILGVNDHSILIQHLPPYITGRNDNSGNESMLFQQYMDKAEKEIVSKALALCANNRVKTANLLGLNRTTLWRIIKKHGLDRVMLTK